MSTASNHLVSLQIPLFFEGKCFGLNRDPQNGQPLIFFIGDNFKRWFLSKKEEAFGQEKISLSHCYIKHIKDLTPDPSRKEIPLSILWELIFRQGQGQSGVLLANCRFNFFSVRDISGIVREVRVQWCMDGWRILADEVGTYQDAPCRVFSAEKKP